MAKRRKQARKGGRFVKASAAPRKRRVTRRRKSTARRAKRRTVAVAAPRRRRRKSNPRHIARRSRRRSNPRFSVSGITSQLIPAVYGAGGALVLDVALGYIPMPAVLQSGYGRHAVRIVGALGIGWAANKFLRGKGAAVGQGALTVAVYGLLKDVAGKVLGSSVKGLAGDFEEMQVGGYLDPAANMGAYMSDAPGIGAYMSSDAMGDSDY